MLHELVRGTDLVVLNPNLSTRGPGPRFLEEPALFLELARISFPEAFLAALCGRLSPIRTARHCTSYRGLPQLGMCEQIER